MIENEKNETENAREDGPASDNAADEKQGEQNQEQEATGTDRSEGESGEPSQRPKLKLKKKTGDKASESVSSSSNTKSTEPSSSELREGDKSEGAEQSKDEEAGEQSSETEDSASAASDGGGGTNKYRLAFAPRSGWEINKTDSAAETGKAGRKESEGEGESTIDDGGKGGVSELARTAAAFLLFTTAAFFSHAEMFFIWIDEGRLFTPFPLTLSAVTAIFAVAVLLRRRWANFLAGSLAVLLIVYCGLLLAELFALNLLPESLLARQDLMGGLPFLLPALLMSSGAMILLTGGGVKRWICVFLLLSIAGGAMLASPEENIPAAWKEATMREKTEKNLPYFLVTDVMWEDFLPSRWEFQDGLSADLNKPGSGKAVFEVADSSLVLTVRMLGVDIGKEGRLTTLTTEQYEKLRRRHPGYSLAYLETEQKRDCKKITAFDSEGQIELFVLQVRDVFYTAKIRGSEEDFEEEKQLLDSTGVKLERARSHFRRYEER